ncbi:MAG: type II toxin-antitoxin system RelE/ParE family toxin [Treponema sp.]|jgi:mRNA-degrading endonuclease RelE of RelBE toxin-antitoxin system|nr:type II toxin-antitoxin system RelE/ParE family toxin [Treponema sp.]
MEIELRNKARKYLDRMNEPHKSIVIAVLNKLEREPPEGDIKPLVGQKGFFRAKAGDFRILFTIREADIFVTNIIPRGQAYNKKEKQK